MEIVPLLKEPSIDLIMVGLESILIFGILAVISHFVSRNKISKILIYIVCAIVLIISFSLIYDVLLYMLEYESDNILESNELIVDYVSNMNGTHIKSMDGDIYRFFDGNRSNFEDFDTMFLDKKCEIQYYKLSKYVTKIIIIG